MRPAGTVGGVDALPDSDLERVAARLEGTCDSVEHALMHLELDADPEEVADQLLDVDLERCGGCGWWMEPGELVDDEGDVVGCGDCRGGD